MSQVFDAFWRALAYCLHPRIIFLSLLPLVIAASLALGLSWFFWEPAVHGVRALLEQWNLLQSLFDWLDKLSAGAFRAVAAPLIVISLAVPVLLIVSLVLVSAFMGGAIVEIVARRRFPVLETSGKAGLARSLLWSLSSMVLALVMLAVTLPLWLIPPLPLLLPPLIWGWLSYRVMTFDALSLHATPAERKTLMKGNRGSLLVIGMVTAYLGVAPSLIWMVTGVMAVPLMPLLLPVFVWVYTLVFAFAALWFTHFSLATLERQRAGTVREVVGAEDVTDRLSAAQNKSLGMGQAAAGQPPSSSPEKAS